MGNKSSFGTEVANLVELHRQTLSTSIEGSSARKAEVHPLFEIRIALSVAETAMSIGVSQKSVERMIKRGELEVKRVGRRVVIARTVIEAWLTRKD